MSSRNLYLALAGETGVKVLPNLAAVSPSVRDVVSVGSIAADGSVRLTFTAPPTPDITVADTPPALTNGALWFCSTDTQLYVGYVDPSGPGQWVIANNTGMSGSYLPLSGGTLTGPLNWTSTGSTTSRAAQDRTAEVRNVRDFGAIGNGTADDTAAINSAIAALPSSGGVLSFPPGRYLITTQIKIPSNTLVRGPATLLAGSAFSMLTNTHNSATMLTDTNIVIEAMTFDYGSSGAGGAYHCIDMIYASNVRIGSCVFQCRGAGNAVALLACYNTMVQNCTAYGFTNCAYDHWQGPQNAIVAGCYAETAFSAQMVNFNPDPTIGSATGWVADGFVLQDCVLVATGANSIPIQIEPLSGGTVQHATISGNVFKNVTLVTRGDSRRIAVTGNVFEGPTNDTSAFAAYPKTGATPDGITFTGNTISNPQTGGGSLAAVRVQATNSLVIGNTFTGTSLYASAYVDSGAIAAGNSYPGGAYTTLGASGPFRAPGGVTAGGAITAGAGVTATGSVSTTGQFLCTTTPSSASDLTHGLQLASGYGLNATSGLLNLNVASGGAVNFVINGTGSGYINNTGLNAVAVGVQTASTGTFTTLYASAAATVNAGLGFGNNVAASITDLTKHIALYGTGPPVYGFCVTGGFINYVVPSSAAHQFVVNGVVVGSIGASGIMTGPAGSPTWTSGSAAPAATAPVGSLYSRVGGAVGATLYVSRGGGTWAAVAGV